MMLLLPAGFSAVTEFQMVAPSPNPPPPKPGPDPGGQGEDFGKAAPLGLVVLLLFFLVVALLVRSMNKHLRRVPESFEDKPGTGPREK